MKKFSYCWFAFGDERANSALKFYQPWDRHADTMAILGGDGWEAYAAVPSNNGTVFFYFKKQQVF